MILIHLVNVLQLYDIKKYSMEILT